MKIILVCDKCGNEQEPNKYNMCDKCHSGNTYTAEV
jgi:NMD protein affecting ribosome stability and mRNA decay